MKKPLFRGICFTICLLNVLLFSGCGPVPEEELLPVYQSGKSPYFYKAFFINSLNDTTAVYNLELAIIEPKSNIEGKNGNYSFSFNTGGESYKTLWKITSDNAISDTLSYDGSLMKTESGISLELPKSGPFKPLRHTFGLNGSVNDKEGSKTVAEKNSFEKSASDIQSYNTAREVVKTGDFTWGDQTLKTWFYEASTTHGDVVTKENYLLNPVHGFLRAYFEVPVTDSLSSGAEKVRIHLLQVPKKRPLAAK